MDNFLGRMEGLTGASPFASISNVVRRSRQASDAQAAAREGATNRILEHMAKQAINLDVARQNFERQQQGADAAHQRAKDLAEHKADITGKATQQNFDLQQQSADAAHERAKESTSHKTTEAVRGHSERLAASRQDVIERNNAAARAKRIADLETERPTHFVNPADTNPNVNTAGTVDSTIQGIYDIRNSALGGTTKKAGRQRLQEFLNAAPVTAADKEMDKRRATPAEAAAAETPFAG